MKHCLRPRVPNIITLSPQRFLGLPRNAQIGEITLQESNSSVQRGLLFPNFNISKKMVVLIGCEYINYKTRGKMERLPGCHMDIKLAQKMLIEHYKYDPSNFIILSDESSAYIQPTRANIVAQLNSVISRTDLTQIVLYYSGHGTQSVDRNGDEEDGMDECIVPCDFMENGLITDDAFHDLVWCRLPLKTKMTCIFDSCNSGTIFDLPFKYNGSNQLKRDTKATPQKITTALPLIITISGCRDAQTSASANKLEKNIEWEGAMSYSLREILKKNNYRPFGINVLIDEMRQLLTKLKFSQVPQMGISRDIVPSSITELF
jgi:hypothetical protein